MWKSRTDEKPAATPQGQPQAPQFQATPVAKAPAAVPNFKEVGPVEAPKQDNYRADVAHIGKSVLVKGELSGSEDLYLDGEVEGSVLLKDHSLVIGPHGRVRANIHAKDVVVHGKVDGNVIGTDRVELKKSAVLSGDISTARIVIEDGAYFKGAIDIKKETKGEARNAEAPKPKAMAAAISFPEAPAATATSSQAPAMGEQKRF